MVNLNDLTADLHIGYKVTLGIAFGLLIVWVGWSIIKFVTNFFTPKTKEQKIKV